MSYEFLARYQFTPAASRALVAAARWTSGGDPGAVAPTELLLGLLDESESRAAEMLAARGIDTTAVLARWPQLKAEGRRQKAETSEEQQTAAFSPELQDALAGASCRLADFPRPMELATEHLLLGLVAAQGELADWLVEQGFDAAVLADEICRFYGCGHEEGSGTQRVPGVQGS
ncbi:MAG: Clp protease N-terminal domain-containing protein, partial [Pirellulales bacterium]